MSKNRKKIRRSELPGPLRKIVRRPDGRGWCVAVSEPHETLYRYVGNYSTAAEARQAIRDGIGAQPISLFAVEYCARRGSVCVVELLDVVRVFIGTRADCLREAVRLRRVHAEDRSHRN